MASTLRPLLSLLLIHLLIFLQLCVENTCSATTEAETLIQWKESLSDPSGSGRLSSWRNSDPAHVCQWTGIQCSSSGAISEIDVSSMRLDGKLDQLNFSAFPNLKSLNLSINFLKGSISSSIGHLKNLQVLDLHRNMLSSSIPPELGLCTSLTLLALSQNSLTGQLPKSLNNLMNILWLDLSDNALSGEISPDLLASWTQLTSFQLHNNQFNGTIPPEIGQLTKLEFLYLYNNSFFGSIPPEIGSLKDLHVLDLSENHLSGLVPPSIWSLKNLSALHLSSNNLTGVIPPEVGNLKNLQVLNVHFNQFHGEVPSNLSSLTELSVLCLMNNNFSGTLPHDLGKNSPFLNKVSFSVNNFSGQLPPHLCSGLALEELTVDNNKFSGPVPDCLRNCSLLMRVRLDSNQFTGNISEAFGIHPILYFFKASKNHFGGEISPQWARCSSLTSLELDGNRILGQIPENLGKLSILNTLSLDSNQLSGKIPDELGLLRSLVTINLSRNHLVGEVPTSIGQLRDLQYLDFSENGLTGLIPHQIIHCTQLLYLNLSRNGLSGELPPEISHLYQLNSLDFSSNLLSGSITANIQNLTSLRDLNLSHNHISGTIPSELSSLAGLQLIDLSYNSLTGQVPGGNFQYGIYTGNPGLCGNFVKGLASCKNRSSLSKAMIVTAIAVPTACILFLAMSMVVILACQKNSKKKTTVEDTNMSEVWGGEAKFKFSEIMEATEDFNEEYCIGEGGFGSVYKAALARGQVFAVKQLIDTSQYSEPVKQWSFLNEVRTLTKVRHRNVIKLHGFCYWRRRMYLMYDYVEKGSLGKILCSKEGVKELSWEKRLKIVQGLAHALAYLHHDCFPPIVHGDISTNNVLLDAEFEPKLSDFGTAKFITQDTSDWTSAVGSFGYMAPELAQMVRVTPKCDVYSFGVVALEVVMGKHPGDLLNSLVTVSSMNNGQDIVMSDVLDSRLSPPVEQLADILEFTIRVGLRCTGPKPESRPTMHQVAKAFAYRSKPS